MRRALLLAQAGVAARHKKCLEGLQVLGIADERRKARTLDIARAFLKPRLCCAHQSLQRRIIERLSSVKMKVEEKLSAINLRSAVSTLMVCVVISTFPGVLQGFSRKPPHLNHTDVCTYLRLPQYASRSRMVDCVCVPSDMVWYMIVSYDMVL